MKQNGAKINTYPSSTSYTAFPVSYERVAPQSGIDSQSFYPPLYSDGTNSVLNLTQSLLKKQEQEIKSQLSPSFWDRLNEATKRASSSNNTTYDYSNVYSSYQPLKQINNQKPQTMTSVSSLQNGYTKPTENNSKNNFEFNAPSTRITNYYQFRSNEQSKPANMYLQSKTMTNTESYSNPKVFQERTTPRVSTIEKSQTFVDTNQNSLQTLSTKQTDENLTSYRNMPINRPVQRSLTQHIPPVILHPQPQTLTQAPIQAPAPAPTQIQTPNQIQPPPSPNQSVQNKTILLINDNKPQVSSFQANVGSSKEILSHDDKSVFIPLGKKSSSSSTNINTNDNKLPSTMSSGNIPQLKQESVRRSKTMTLNDKDKYLKSIGVNVTPINTVLGSGNNTLNKNSVSLSSNGYRNFHKTLSIRSRVNNFYKDFIDEKNCYLSNLVKTNSDINLKASNTNLANNPIELVTKTPPKTPDQVNETNGSKTPEDKMIDINNNNINNNSPEILVNMGDNKNEINLNSNGVSFTTGETGYFPAKNVERVAESETWKLHKKHQLVGSSSSNNLAQQAQIQQTPSSNLLHSQSNGQFITTMDKRNNLQTSESRVNMNSFYYSENPSMQKRFQSSPHKSMQSQGTLRFFFARHGERIDLAFGPQWIEQAFDRTGKYRRINLNMPADLPFRASKREFLGDSPLTEIGQFQARLTGEALGNEGYKLHYCYTSPALRCIQTAHQILSAQGLEKIVKIRIEPSVFEFLGWYDKGLPSFLSQESLVAFGYNIDLNYKPLLPLDRLQQDENYTDYYHRSFNLTKFLTNSHQNEGANILVVGHAGTLEVCTRQITGMPVRPYTEFNATIRKVPYLGLAMLEKEAGSSTFEIQGSIIPALGHTANFNFDPMSLKI